MPEHLYRFRPSVLGKHQELENQEIYFSSLEGLNDPMEGFVDLFWSGDQIVWTNLVKHYLFCLDYACIQFMLIGNTTAIDLASIPVLQTENDLPTQEYKDVYKRICDIFFALPSVPKYVQGLSSRKRPIRRDELSFHLRILHYHALNAIFTVYKDRGVMTDTPDGDAVRVLLERTSLNPEIFEATNNLEASHPKVSDGSDRLYAVLRGAQLQAVLAAKYNNLAVRADNNGNLIFQDFPDHYVKLVDKMVHADWYMACFAENCTNASMWGHYANSHKGVCLKFSTGINAGTAALALNTITGRAGSKTIPAGTPIHNYVNHPFHRIAYRKTFPKIDFFRSLGRLRGMTLGWCYSDGQGNNSACAVDVHLNETAWREKYWAEFLASQTTKLEDWAYEEEYRLVLAGFITDYSNPLTRKLKYRFSDLTGVIFGIDTPEQDKLAIIRVVEKKCRRENRSEFEFYQAHYTQNTGKIEALPLDLIKLSEPRSKSVPKIAILGWGSLLWDKSRKEFDEWHEDWRLDGPVLKLEFSRKSTTRLNALTLVIDPVHGQQCQVAYAMSKRASPEEAIADLRAREKAKGENIGCIFGDGSRRQSRDANSIDVISQWAKDKYIDIVLWTDLPSSFDGVAKHDFLKAAVNHVQRLPPEGKAMAAEYVWRAPDFVVTPLRKTLQAEPWFQKS
jgi:Protein of unknown function (DUF2971)